LRELPADGSHLDVGCGYGILLALLRERSTTQHLYGVDISVKKTDQARTVRGLRCAGFSNDVGELDALRFNSVSLVDVLYLLKDCERKKTIAFCFSVLGSQGTIVIKEVEVSPGWQHWVATIQEFLAVRVFGITDGHHVAFVDTATLVELLEDTGFAVISVRRVDRGYPHRHVLLTAKKRLNDDR
jgi:ubiquinone/menaquinone biosynthesis C-methylase UbiE